MKLTSPLAALAAAFALAGSLGPALGGCSADLDACEFYKTQDSCVKRADKCQWNGSTNSCQDTTESGPARQ